MPAFKFSVLVLFFLAVTFDALIYFLELFVTLISYMAGNLLARVVGLYCCCPVSEHRCYILSSYSGHGQALVRMAPSGIYRYWVPCISGSIHMVQTRRNISKRITEHSIYIQLHQPEKPGLSEHCILLGHQPQWDHIRDHFWDSVILESIFYSYGITIWY